MVLVWSRLGGLEWGSIAAARQRLDRHERTQGGTVTRAMQPAGTAARPRRVPTIVIRRRQDDCPAFPPPPAAPRASCPAIVAGLSAILRDRTRDRIVSQFRPCRHLAT